MYDWNSNTVVVSIPVHRQLDIQCIPVYPCITAGTTGIIGCARLRSQRLRVFELERLIALIAWPLATDSNLHFVNLVWKAGFGHWFRKRCQQDLFQGPWWFLAAWSWSSQPFSWTHDSKRLSYIRIATMFSIQNWQNLEILCICSSIHRWYDRRFRKVSELITAEKQQVSWGPHASQIDEFAVEISRFQDFKVRRFFRSNA